ncbi:uncharacterized protein LOC106516096 isoform X3 [Austrofundulus limnaeus]|uniref:Uncharacterized protein LOC106516096 isoform X3 n=1 Tax=Austrofundulus limnaeus TaxID=52670 RepID=A0A2I4B1Z2_AUSLI|nr:PREDICTED: uncharacterized protein LOC106516096 isoform X3 [Austrofundulus limnaeus]
MKPNISSEHSGPSAVAEFQHTPVWMCRNNVSLHADLHGVSRQQMDPTESEVQIVVNALFVVVVLAPQLFVMGRPKSSRYCRQPLLNNLATSVALSIIASGFSVTFTLMDPVHQSLWAAFHVFGLLSCGHGLSTIILTLTAEARTTPELYYMSVALTVTSTFSTGFFMVRGGLWLTKRQGDKQKQGETKRSSCHLIPFF